jgi:hypothetical protein
MRSHSLNLLTANCLQQRFAIAPLQLPQTSFFNEPQRHRGHREREIAPLNLPNSDRTSSTSQHPFLTNHVRGASRRDRCEEHKGRGERSQLLPQILQSNLERHLLTSRTARGKLTFRELW